MNLNILKPKKTLNKAFLKIKPIRSEIEVFKDNLVGLLDNSNDTESEEFHKNLVSDFLKKTYFDQYFTGKKKGFAISVRNPKLYKQPKNLKEKFGMVPSQSFAYLRIG